MSQTPLSGLKVLIPRGKKQAGSFSELVKKQGGIPVEIPLIDFKQVEQATIPNNLSSYDWIIFTSNTTVSYFLSLWDHKTTMPKIAVIGEKTEEFLIEKGFEIEFVPTEYVAEAFVEEFLLVVQKGERVFIPKGNLARSHIGKSLREYGVFVRETILYETYFPDESKQLLKDTLVQKKLNVLAFTSPSTIDHFMQVVNEYELQDCLEGVVTVCIGPVTKKKLESYNLQVDVMAKVYTVDEMLNCLIQYLETRKC